ncbi:MAG: response regulator [Bacteroidales bacterium]|nr:response regulator [Bacteroidales bacterium]
MEIKMPKMDGYEATRKIREFNSKVPIIAHTAYTLTEDRKKAMNAGCDDFMPKPIRPAILREMVQKYLS